MINEKKSILIYNLINMKKTVIAALFLLLGCSKQDSTNTNTQKKCYTIIFGTSLGGASCERKSPLDTCIDPWVNISSLKFVDKCNNELSWIIK